MVARICIGTGLLLLGLGMIGVNIGGLDAITGFLLFFGGLAMLIGV